MTVLCHFKLVHPVLGQLSEHHLLDAAASILRPELETHAGLAPKRGEMEQEDEHPDRHARTNPRVP